MNKTEKKEALNKLVFKMVAELNYEVIEEGEGGRVTFIRPGYKDLYDSIEYNRSHFNVRILNFDATNKTKEDIKTIEQFIKRKVLDI